jgi:hypothetical protein
MRKYVSGRAQPSVLVNVEYAVGNKRRGPALQGRLQYYAGYSTTQFTVVEGGLGFWAPQPVVGTPCNERPQASKHGKIYSFFLLMAEIDQIFKILWVEEVQEILATDQKSLCFTPFWGGEHFIDP